jgi:hypothetical protein
MPGRVTWRCPTHSNWRWPTPPRLALGAGPAVIVRPVARWCCMVPWCVAAGKGPSAPTGLGSVWRVSYLIKHTHALYLPCTGRASPQPVVHRLAFDRRCSTFEPLRRRQEDGAYQRQRFGIRKRERKSRKREQSTEKDVSSQLAAFIPAPIGTSNFPVPPPATTPLLPGSRPTSSQPSSPSVPTYNTSPPPTPLGPTSSAQVQKKRR